MSDSTAGTDSDWQSTLWSYSPPGWFGYEDPFQDTRTEVRAAASGAGESLSQAARDVKDIAGNTPDAMAAEAARKYDEWKRTQTRNMLLGIGGVIAVTGLIGYVSYRYLGAE